MCAKQRKKKRQCSRLKDSNKFENKSFEKQIEKAEQEKKKSVLTVVKGTAMEQEMK